MIDLFFLQLRNAYMKYHTRQTLGIYLCHAKKYKYLALALIVFASLGPALNAMVPLYYKEFFNVLVAADIDRVSTLIHILLWSILPLLFVKQLMRRLASFVDGYFNAYMMRDLAQTCFAYLHKHSFSFFHNNFVGSLVKQVNYFSRSFDAISDRFTWFFLPMIVEIVIMFFVFFGRDWRLGMLVLIWLVFFIALNLILTRYKMRYDVARSAAETSATGTMADTITNHSNVKLFGGYTREGSRFRTAIQRVTDLRLKSWNIGNITDVVQGFFTMGLEIGIMVVGVQLWQAGILTPGDFIVLQAYFLQLFDKVWDFGKNIRGLYENLADAEDMTVILATPHEITGAPGAAALTMTGGQIDFQAVAFYYHETREVLSGFTLRIAGGEKVALVGPSGAGKSTIVKLLLRQHDVADGQISIDGQTINRITQESLWAAISWVPQDPILFHRTLMENIRYGRPDATDDEVKQAATLAHCHEFISSFPDGYSTYVGERGVKLSGGERQRVAIARAILRDAPILILDEATSSLDSESERLVQDALATLMKGKTVIVIAHRLSTIMKMDRIVVLNSGRIVEQGSHALLTKKKGGLYQRLWKLQAGGFIIG